MSSKIFLKDYTSPAFEVDFVHLTFNLWPEKTIVTARTKYKKLKNEALILNGGSQKILSIKLDNLALSEKMYALREQDLVIAATPEHFEIEIVCELNPENNKSLEGLYQSKGIVCTQCEAESFRKITYFMDRPDVMTKYSVDIEADKKLFPVLLSNGDRISASDLGNGRHRVSWRDPHKKPAYLFALVAGDLGVIKDTFTTKSGKKVNLEIYAAHGKQDRCHHAMESLKKAMKWDEETFGLEYDLNDFMIVAVDDFNAGAMENKGLNIFNSRLVLADPTSATDADYNAIESVIAHEYFHNWTGNRITCRDWFQLSLKEGLTVYRDQEFSADVGSRGVQRIHDVDSLKVRQFSEDAGPNAHPVRPESCMAVDNFYTATIYEKGAEVIRMMEKLVGKKGFRKGMDLYFSRHDGQAVTTDDFAAAISEANQKDFQQFKLWYSQAGTPKVRVQENYIAEKNEFHLTLSQSCLPTPGQTEKKPFHIPMLVGLLNSKATNNENRNFKIESDHVSKNTDGNFLVELKEAQQTFIFKNLNSRPILSLNREFSAPINLDWDASSDDLAYLVKFDSDSFNRRESVQKLALNELRARVKAFQENKVSTFKANSVFVDAYGEVLQDQNIDPAFKAILLELPSMIILTQAESVIDAAAFDFARASLGAELAQSHQSKLVELYLSLKSSNSKDLSFLAIGQRALKNQILSLLGFLSTPQIEAFAFEQFTTAQNMTDQYAAMSVLTNAGFAKAEDALNSFYHQWKDDSLVLNKWLVVQSTSRAKDTFERVQRLSRHPSFDIKNPNNIMSLLSAFSMNIVRFNDESTDTYAFYADQIEKIDANNPNVAARISGGFNFVKKLKPEQKKKALAAIQKLLQKTELSKNSREILQSSV